MIILDYTPMIDMQYDQANRYTIKLNIIVFGTQKRPVEQQRLSLWMTVHKETTMRDLYYETATLPTLMQGQTLSEDYQSIVYALRDNRMAM